MVAWRDAARVACLPEDVLRCVAYWHRASTPRRTTFAACLILDYLAASCCGGSVPLLLSSHLTPLLSFPYCILWAKALGARARQRVRSGDRQRISTKSKRRFGAARARRHKRAPHHTCLHTPSACTHLPHTTHTHCLLPLPHHSHCLPPAHTSLHSLLTPHSLTPSLPSLYLPIHISATTLSLSSLLHYIYLDLRKKDRTLAITWRGGKQW